MTLTLTKPFDLSTLPAHDDPQWVLIAKHLAEQSEASQVEIHFRDAMTQGGKFGCDRSYVWPGDPPDEHED